VRNGQRSFSAFCEHIGLPLKNARWSWSAINSEQSQAIFTIWDNEILPDGQSYEIWHGQSDDKRKDHGSREMKRVVVEALSAGFECFGIRCFPKYPLTSPRTRERYDNINLIRLQLERTGDRIIARFTGLARAEDVRAGIPILESMLGSALDDLDEVPSGCVEPQRVDVVGQFIVRNFQVRQYVLKRAKGRCEYCGTRGFTKIDGKGYLEAHHIISLAEQGPDTPGNVIALCANHHREAHYGAERLALEREFQVILCGLSGTK
jgi:5-methylcytosine-specific restriction protein A